MRRRCANWGWSRDRPSPRTVERQSSFAALMQVTRERLLSRGRCWPTPTRRRERKPPGLSERSATHPTSRVSIPSLGVTTRTPQPTRSLRSAGSQRGRILQRRRQASFANSRLTPGPTYARTRWRALAYRAHVVAMALRGAPFWQRTRAKTSGPPPRRLLRAPAGSTTKVRSIDAPTATPRAWSPHVAMRRPFCRGRTHASLVYVVPDRAQRRHGQTAPYAMLFASGLLRAGLTDRAWRGLRPRRRRGRHHAPQTERSIPLTDRNLVLA